MTIHLASMLPSRSSDLPGNSGGPPSSVSLFGLAPDGVYQAPAVTDETGELLPHLFTLTPGAGPEAVSFLWHFPSCRQDWALPSTLSYGARTFLSLAQRQGGGHLSYSNIPERKIPAFRILEKTGKKSALFNHILITLILTPIDNANAIGATHQSITSN